MVTAAMVLLVLVLIVVMVTAAMVLLVLVLIVVMVAAAVVLLVLVLVVVMVAAAVVLLVLVLVVVMVAAAAVTVMVMVMLVLQVHQIRSLGGISLHGGDELLTSQQIPGGGNDGRLAVVLLQQCQRRIQLLLLDGISAGEDDGGGSLDLVVVELAKVLHINLDLTGIGNGNGVADLHVVPRHLLDSRHHIGQLAHAAGFNDDPVRVELVNDLLQCLAEVAHQGAANAAGVHLGDVDARILQEAAVNADLTEFILNEHQLLALVALLDHFLDKGGLAGSQEAGVNVNFRHHVLQPPKKIFRVVFLYIICIIPQRNQKIYILLRFSLSCCGAL